MPEDKKDEVYNGDVPAPFMVGKGRVYDAKVLLDPQGDRDLLNRFHAEAAKITPKSKN